MIVTTESAKLLDLLERRFDKRQLELIFRRQINLSINKNTNKTVLRIEKFSVFLELIYFHHFDGQKFEFFIVVNDPAIKILFGLFKVLK